MKAYKDFLPSIFFKRLEAIVSANNFPYYFQQTTLGKDKKESLDNFMFTHVLFNDGKERSDWFKIFEPIIYFISEKYEVNELLRMKLNLYTNQHKKINHGSHKDYEGPLKLDIKLGLLNFITCNGGTKINKKLFNSNSNELIVFDNKFKHYGITQTDTPTRINLNIAWK
mgnify:FL=1|tara:strand:+ start:89 stop:595 length:507 start_codon:yes stop_codon:yes gene_type:complete